MLFFTLTTPIIPAIIQKKETKKGFKDGMGTYTAGASRTATAGMKFAPSGPPVILIIQCLHIYMRLLKHQKAEWNILTTTSLKMTLWLTNDIFPHFQT